MDAFSDDSASTRVDATLEDTKQAEFLKDESRYLALISASPVGIFHTDVNGFVTFVNSKWCEIAGLTVEESLGKGWLSAIHPEDRDEVILDWHKNASTRRQSYIKEQRYQRKDGITTYCLVESHLEFDVGGMPIGYVGTITDISELKRREETLENDLENLKSIIAEKTAGISRELSKRKLAERKALEAAEKAEQSTQVKTNFLANMSHELRTPLNSIIGFSQLLEREIYGSVGSAQNKEYANIILTSGQYLHRLLGQILDISKIESDQYDLRMEAISLKDLCDESLNVMKGSLEEKDIVLECDFHDKDHRVWGDRTMVEQVLIILLSNSIKFSEANSTITIASNFDRDEYIRIQVKDQGVGIPKNQIEKVINQFERGDPTIASNHKGTGLGLYLANKYASLNGGKLEIESKKDVGTIVSLYLPAHKQ